MSTEHILDDFDFDDDFDPESGDSDVAATFYSSMEAEVAAARLRTEGIPCFLANNITQNVMTSIQVLVRLHVRKADVERAREILRETMPQPEAGSENKGKGALIFMAVLIALIVLGLLVVAIGRK
jgi:uncharacterized membrane protein YgcG